MFKKYNWPLNDSHFTKEDRQKIADFFLDENNRWTAGELVRQYERKWEEYVGVKHAIMVSSGSAANRLIAETRKSELVANGEWPRRNKVVVPAVTWQTSVSPWISLGYDPVFIDVDPTNYQMDGTVLKKYLKCDKESVAAIFPTSLLGFNSDHNFLADICDVFGVAVYIDNCENSFGFLGLYNRTHVCKPFTSSTSFYFGHQTTTGSEGGMIFTNKDSEAKEYILRRSHGMVRVLDQYKNKFDISNIENPLVDRLFDFYTLGENYRSSDISAFIGLLDFDKISRNICHRNKIYDKMFRRLQSSSRFSIKYRESGESPFCIPIADRFDNSDLKELLNDLKIEYRPIVGGNLLRQTCYQKYGNYKNYVGAEYVHNNCLYIGLHFGVTEDMVENLTNEMLLL